MDISTHAVWMLNYLAALWRGHLEEVYRIFAYLKKYDRSKNIFDPSMVNWDRMGTFAEVDWKDLYPALPVQEVGG